MKAVKDNLDLITMTQEQFEAYMAGSKSVKEAQKK